MSEALNNFLIDLASSPERLIQFMNNAAGEPEIALLSDEERKALLSRDRDSLRSAMGGTRFAQTEGTNGEGHGRRRRKDGERGRKRGKIQRPALKRGSKRAGSKRRRSGRSSGKKR